MNCKLCKSRIIHEAKYCSQCGTPVKGESKTLYSKTFYMLLIICISLIIISSVFIQLVSASQTTKPANSRVKTFTTPQETIEYYVDALSKGDIQKMAEASGIDIVSEKFNFSVYWSKLGVIKPMFGLLPTKYGNNIPMNKAIIMNQCVRTYAGTFYSLKDISWGINYPCYNIKDALDFENDINPDFLRI